MKKLMFVLMMVSGLAFVVSAQKTGTKVACFKSDMTCTGCENTLTEHLKFEKGVKDLKIDHVSNTILIEYKDGKNSDDDLAKSIEKKGYKAEKITKEEYDKTVSVTKEAVK